jgi:hypothetical protein
MAQFAPVAPIQILERMREEKCLGTYHLLLAHHILEFPDRFRALFNGNDRMRGDPQHTIIVDNSIVELGDSQNEDKVLEACKVLQSGPHEPNWVIPVLTDVMGDGEATRQKAAESHDWWREHAPGWPLMVVLQGKDWADYTQSVDFFMLDPHFTGIEYAGIPRVLTGFLGTRQLAIQYLEAVRPDINTHLLGFSDDVTDDVICCQHPGVEGIDSAVPIRYGYSGGEGLYMPTSEIPPRPKDWFEKGQYDESIWANLEAMRRWVA